MSVEAISASDLNIIRDFLAHCKNGQAGMDAFADLCALSRSMFRDSSNDETFATVEKAIEAYNRNFPLRAVSAEEFAMYLYRTRSRFTEDECQA